MFRYLKSREIGRAKQPGLSEDSLTATHVALRLKRERLRTRYVLKTNNGSDGSNVHEEVEFTDKLIPSMHRKSIYSNLSRVVPKKDMVYLTAQFPIQKLVELGGPIYKLDILIEFMGETIYEQSLDLVRDTDGSYINISYDSLADYNANGLEFKISVRDIVNPSLAFRLNHVVPIHLQLSILVCILCFMVCIFIALFRKT